MNLDTIMWKKVEKLFGDAMQESDKLTVHFVSFPNFILVAYATPTWTSI